MLKIFYRALNSLEKKMECDGEKNYSHEQGMDRLIKKLIISKEKVFTLPSLEKMLYMS